MGNSGLVGRPERIAQEREHEHAGTQGREAGNELKADQGHASKQQAKQLNVVKAEAVGKPAAQKRADKSAESIHRHNNTRILNRVMQVLRQVERHERQYHGAAAVDEHNHGQQPNGGRQARIRPFVEIEGALKHDAKVQRNGFPKLVIQGEN